MAARSGALKSDFRMLLLNDRNNRISAFVILSRQKSAKRSMKNRIVAIARYTILEAVRTRLLLLTVVVIGVLIAGSFLVREIAVTESSRFQTTFYAATVRYACVFIVALYAIASIAREFQDKGLEVVLALDLPRSHYILGKLAGFLVIAAAIAATASLPLIPLAGWQPVAQWAISLAFELGVIVALSLFCVITFNQLIPAFSFVLAFYLLARALTAIRLISANPIADAAAVSHQIMTRLVEALALVIPALDAWTRTAWLVDNPASGPALFSIGAHSALFVAIFASAAVFDMHRRNF
jgi:ABC-type transport system involved in multi-copper enzyme maturation permease subunit